jgi:hypothetical protein
MISGVSFSKRLSMKRLDGMQSDELVCVVTLSSAISDAGITDTLPASVIGAEAACPVSKIVILGVGASPTTW